MASEVDCPHPVPRLVPLLRIVGLCGLVLALTDGRATAQAAEFPKRTFHCLDELKACCYRDHLAANGAASATWTVEVQRPASGTERLAGSLPLGLVERVKPKLTGGQVELSKLPLGAQPVEACDRDGSSQVEVDLDQAAWTDLAAPESGYRYALHETFDGGLENKTIAPTSSALSSVDAAVSELFGILAEVAVEKASARLERLLRDRIAKEVCQLESGGGQIFARTCVLLRVSRLDALTASPRGLLTVLLQDAAAASTSALITSDDFPAGYEPALERLTDAVVEFALLGQKPDTPSLGAAVFNAVAAAIKVPDEEPLRALVLISRACGSIYAQDRDAACPTEKLVASYLDNSGGTLEPRKRATVSEVTSRLARWVERNTRTRSGRPMLGKVEPREALTEALGVAFGIAELAMPSERQKVRRAADLSRAVLEANVVAAVAGTFGLLIDDLSQRNGEGKSTSAARAVGLLNAVVAYAETFQRKGGEPSEEGTLEKMREARKEIVLRFLDEASSRSVLGEARRGANIVSLGLNVGGLMVGGQWTQRSDEWSAHYAQLTLPLTVAFQHQGTDGPGLHVGLIPLDLGQYVSFDPSQGGDVSDPDWRTSLTFGLQAGLLFPSLRDPFVLGVDARYSPALFPEETGEDGVDEGAFRFGLFLSYYIPIFDFEP